MILNVKHTIEDGSLVTLSKGETALFKQLRAQLTVAVVLNNSNSNPFVHFTNGAEVSSIALASTKNQGLSIGACYIFKTYNNKLSVTLSNTAEDAATIDVYLFSSMYPLLSFNKQTALPLDGTQTSLKGYSRGYFTPKAAEYKMEIEAKVPGLVSMFLNGNTDENDLKLNIIGIDTSASEDFRKYIIIGSNITTNMITFNEVASKKIYELPFLGDNNMKVYAPIVPKDTEAVSIKIKKV